MYIRILFILLLSLIIVSCDGGLDPTQVHGSTGYIKGTIDYAKGANWSAAGTVKDIRVVAFKSYPPIGILEEVMGGNAYYTIESLPVNVASSTFSIEIPEPPLTIKYLVVAQQYGGLMDWRAVGVLYSNTPETPSEFTIDKGETKYFDINVDFDNLPPQPFK